jgi:hypothetical protein
MAEMKAASGGAALDAPAGFHEIGTVVRDGISGTYETWGDLRVLRSAGSHTLGGSTGSGGFDGRVAWSLGADGAVHTDTTREGLAASRLGTYLTLGGYFYPDRFPAQFEYRGPRQADGAAYDVVTVTPADSDSADLWLDTATHRLQRISGTAGTATFLGVVERYQVVDGVWIAFALNQTEGSHQMVQELTSFVFEPVPAERFSARR